MYVLILLLLLLLLCSTVLHCCSKSWKQSIAFMLTSIN